MGNQLYPMVVSSGALLAAVAMVSPLSAVTLELDARLLKATPTPTLLQVAPYPRALCTYLYEVERVHRGEFTEDKILVVKWALWEKAPVKGLPRKVGAVERLKLERWIDYPNFNRERIVDAIREVDRVIYFDVNSQPRPQPASGLEELLAGKEKEWASGVVEGESEGWLFLAEELRHARKGRFWEQDWTTISRATVDPLPALLDFQRRLANLDTRLLIVPVPSKVAVYPDRLAEGLQVEPLAPFVKRMQSAGLKVLDLEPVFARHRAREGTRPLYCAQDSHWSPQGCRVAAQAIRAWMKLPSADWPKGTRLVNSTREIRGDLARMLPGPAMPPEKLSLSEVRFADVGATVGLRHPESAVVLLGDSHVTVFSEGGEEMHGSGSGLPDYLFRELGMRADVIASHGDGVNQARVNLYQQRSVNPAYPGYWKNKKWVIWVFAAREFTGAENWSAKIPVVKKQP